MRDLVATMSFQPLPELAATVDVLKNAFESGRSVDLKIGKGEEPSSGCVSHIHEGATAGDYVFSAFVGDEQIVITGSDYTRKR